MRTAYFDCFSGISGDMCLGALVSAGVPLGSLKKELEKARISGYALASRKARRAGVEALKVEVELTGEKEKCRKYKDIAKIIRESRLSPSVKKRGLHIFRRLFEAEALVHGEPYTKVHLHELGAVDALVDVLGTLVCLEALGIERVVASPLNLGSGTVATSHGELPVPAPATLRLLEGAPAYSSGHPYELTTPTGAAIITGVASAYGDMPLMRLEKAGIGAGGRNVRGRPNVLRVLIGEALASEEEVSVVETNIDDMDPRLYEVVMDKLFKAGALDVFLTNILMKKGRPGVKLTVLCDERRRPRLSEIVLRETTTLGVRHSRAGRTVLERKTGKVETRFGPVRVKVASVDGTVKAMPEYEDLRRAAKRHGVPISEVAAEAARRFKG
ncbi:MAG: nickel pincer cofactor biosynthesis protein LarC [Nitrospirota bacterium]|jgi:uncharacterized protein (TIGR00299 family) protein